MMINLFVLSLLLWLKSECDIKHTLWHRLAMCAHNIDTFRPWREFKIWEHWSGFTCVSKVILRLGYQQNDKMTILLWNPQLRVWRLRQCYHKTQFDDHTKFIKRLPTIRLMGCLSWEWNFRRLTANKLTGNIIVISASREWQARC